MKGLIRSLARAVYNPAPVLPMPGPREPDAVDIAVMFLEDVPAHLVGAALYARLTHPAAVGGKLNAEQLYDISNRVGRLAHAVARVEDEKRERDERVRRKIGEAVASFEARRAAAGGRNAR